MTHSIETIFSSPPVPKLMMELVVLYILTRNSRCA